MHPTSAPNLAPSRNDWLVAAALAAVTFAVFAPALDAHFIDMDDTDYVTHNPQVLHGLSPAGAAWAFSTFHAGNWHPLTWLSLQLDATVWKTANGRPDARGFHLTNVCLHAANAGLLFLAVRALSGASWRSAAVALLFAVHPLRVESVAWVAERKDVLSVTFGLLALWAYAAYAAAPSVRRYSAVALGLALSLLAKPMLVTLPFLLLVLDWWPLRRVREKNNWGRLVLEKVPLLALCLASCVTTVLAQTGAMASLNKAPLSLRLETAVVAGATYLGLAVWPVHLAVYYPMPLHGWPAWRLTVSAMTLAGLTTVAVWQRLRRPYLLAGWLWFLGTLMPVIGLVQVGMQAYADRYTYFPEIGLAIALCWYAAEVAVAWPRAVPVAIGGLAVGLAVLTRIQLTPWDDTMTLWEHANATTGETVWGLTHLGETLKQQEKYEKAAERYRAVLAMDPTSVVGHNELGVIYRRQGKLEEAEKSLREARRLAPENPGVRMNMGVVLWQKKEYAAAAAEINEAVRLKPEMFDAWNNLGTVEEARGNLQVAEDCYRKALGIRPDFPPALASLGNLLWRAGHADQAIALLREAVHNDPGLGQAHLALGVALEEKGDLTDAAAQLDTAARLTNQASAWYHLGTVRIRQGRSQQAVNALAKAVERQPTAEHCGTLAAALVEVAAAHAAARQFSAAVAAARQARELAASAGRDELVKQIDARLRLYEHGESGPVPGMP
jgi:tetratricopeptide (TPR) repeat protein